MILFILALALQTLEAEQAKCDSAVRGLACLYSNCNK